jgi:putative ATP-binding cassette transporter
MLLFNLLRSNPKIDLRMVLALLTMSAVATTLVLVVVNLASQQADQDGVDFQLLLLMILSLGGFMWSQHKSDVMVSNEVERILHGFRTSLFDRVRRSEPETLDKVGQGPIQTAMTSEMQTISNALPVMLSGVQQFVVIIAVSVYLAYLSLFAFAMIGVLVLLASAIHIHRMKRINAANREALDDEGMLFGGLSDLLEGFKEVKMNDRRRASLLGALNERSERVRDSKSETRAQWAREGASIQLAFYTMMAAMVFVVPIFTSDYHDVAVQTTTASLFLIGPIGAVIMAVPNYMNAHSSLMKITELEEEFRETFEAVQSQTAEDSKQTPAIAAALADIKEIALSNVEFTYPGARGGFGVGPLNASFKRGEIVFITGANGAGKSTAIGVLTGLRKADRGEVKVNGIAISPEDLQAYRDQFATVLSDYHLFGELYGIEPIDAEKVNALIREMEIDHKVSLNGTSFSTTSLSQGQRKRLALIVARLEDKPVLVLDEWAADQDPHFRVVFYQQILPALRDQGKVIICVTHDDRWFDVADRIYHVRDGVFDDVQVN